MVLKIYQNFNVPQSLTKLRVVFFLSLLWLTSCYKSSANHNTVNETDSDLQSTSTEILEQETVTDSSSALQLNTIDAEIEERPITTLLESNEDEVEEQPIPAVVTRIHLPRTGQTSCYHLTEIVDCTGTGQDGEFQKGVAWPTPRYLTNGDGTITDSLTELMWVQDLNLMENRDSDFDNHNQGLFNNFGDGKVSWEMALEYITQLNNENYLGYSDWRLPNRNELLSLAHYPLDDSLTHLRNSGFYFGSDRNFYLDYYWSSTTSPEDTSFAIWVIPGSARSGSLPKAQEYGLMILPVRGGSDDALSAIPQTGQTACYDSEGSIISCVGTGQDGDSLAGVQWPIHRFSINGETTIDLLTGLMWVTDNNLILTRNPSFDIDHEVNGLTRWQTALSYIQLLNEEQYLGYSDWRIPNVNELRSIVQTPIIDENHISPTEERLDRLIRYYWTSTTALSYPEIPDFQSTRAWVINLHDGESFLSQTLEDDVSFIWPVRDYDIED